MIVHFYHFMVKPTFDFKFTNDSDNFSIHFNFQTSAGTFKLEESFVAEAAQLGKFGSKLQAESFPSLFSQGLELTGLIKVMKSFGIRGISMVLV